jgi:hypothetical protein
MLSVGFSRPVWKSFRFKNYGARGSRDVVLTRKTQGLDDSGRRAQDVIMRRTQDARLRTQAGFWRVKARIALLSPSGQVVDGRMMIYSGSARPISTGHDVIYEVTC